MYIKVLNFICQKVVEINCQNFNCQNLLKSIAAYTCLIHYSICMKLVSKELNKIIIDAISVLKNKVGQTIKGEN